MAGYQTALYVASQSANELVVVVTPFNANSYGWVWIASLLCLVVSYGLLFNQRKNLQAQTNPAFRLIWLLPIVITAPFLVMGVIGEIKTQITLSALKLLRASRSGPDAAPFVSAAHPVE